MIQDNILITPELLHYLQSSKNDPNKGFVIKLDMNKTYDLQRETFGDLLGMKVVEKWDNYLGLPLPVFLAPKGVIEDIQAKISRTWWLGKEKGGFWTMLPWKTLCHPKGMGGLGIRDIQLLNLAFLGHQVWRFINNKDTLCFKVLSSKYFRDGDIFHPKRVEKASFTWSSIAAAAKAFKDGFGWQVGSGIRINIWIDNWGLEGLNGGVLNSNMLNPNECSVKDLWLGDCRSWNIGKVHELYGQDLGDKICNLLIGGEGQCDRTVWFHNPHVCFTSKSAYSWLLLKEMGLGPHRFFWKALWKLDTIPKVRVFTWRVGHDILPTNVKIASIQRGFGQGCPRCGAEYEPLVYALKDCPTSRATLSIGGWNETTISKDYKNCIDWLEDMMRVLDKRAMTNLMTTLWNCWNNSNSFIFRGKKEEAQVIWDRASTLSQDFHICNLMNELLLSPNLAVKKWEQPPRVFVKINFDATGVITELVME
ncbi:Ribonuclease H-like superfamily protein [Gossypium australe]|uniref:Ribonuclease H-like superfamily protein n=1 Tax=Gossypium australe TaxID=47621 RepID=A0A5B6WQ97_9ROSI|nr:Ribonuclease H-like superfamily protein [Gossypium australe]